MVQEVESARAQVERISHSKTFRNSDVLKHLLTYLADVSITGNADDLKEYTVGVDALGKPPSYDPRQESAVRMQVARLRQKLAEYYRTEGLEDPVIVDLPKGGFKVTFDPRPAHAEPFEAHTSTDLAPIPPSGWRTREIILAVAVVIAIAAATLYGVRYTQLQAKVAAEDIAPWTPDLEALWQPLLSGNRPLVVCIATPLSVLFPGTGYLRLFDLNDWQDAGSSKPVADLKQNLHLEPMPSFAYTGVGTASAAFVLGQFLGQHKQSTLLTRANLLSLPELMEENVVFLGPLTGSRENEALQVNQEIVLEAGGIRNRHPKPGEPEFISEQAVPPAMDNMETHALISRVPGLRGKGEILSIAGNQISSVMAGAQALTDPSVAKMLVNEMKTADGKMPKYFQVVLRVKSMDGVPTEIAYMFHRQLQVTQRPAAQP
jgi:hypothetical protein